MDSDSANTEKLWTKNISMFFICIQKYDSKSSSLEFNVFYARYSH